MVRLRDLQDYESLPTTSWNIKQPAEDEVREEGLEQGLDLILMPGLAFTEDGKRLGRGKGYYDTYLEKAIKAAKVAGKAAPKTIALAFKEQIVEDIPMSEHDKVIDKVIFDKS